MTDLRERLRDLDSLEVPDVMQQAHRLGPKPPMAPAHPAHPTRRIAIAVFSLLLAVTSVLYVTRAFDRGAGPAPASPTPAPPARCAWTTTDLHLPEGNPREAASLVAGSSLSDLWVVASKHPWLDQHLLHYDGQDWSQVSLPNELEMFASGDMVAPAPNDLWLLAPNGVERFDGTSWTRSDFPGLDRTTQQDLELLDLEVTAPDDAWVTGNVYDQATDTWGPLLLHWDGSAWDRTDGDPAGEGLTRAVAVSAWGPDDVWVAGVMAGTPNAAPVAIHWDGTAWTARPVLGPDGRAARTDPFGLAAIGPDEALVAVDKGVVRWKDGSWSDTGFEASSWMDTPVAVVQGTSGVWAKVWNTGVARWNGETWQQRPLGWLYSYGMTVIDGTAVFVGAGPGAQAIEC